MAARKQGKKVVPVQPDEEERDVLADLLVQFGAVAHTVKLRRQSETPPRLWQYVGVLDLTPDLIEDVKEKYGGGNYRGLVYNETGYVRGATIPFSIAGRPKAGDEVEPAGEDRYARLEAKLEKLLEAKPTDGFEKFLGMATGIITVATPLLVPLFKNLGGGQDVLATMQLVRDAEREGERRGERLGALAAGVAGESFGDVAKQFFPPILNLMGEAMRKGRPNGAQPPAPGGEVMPASPALPAVPLAPEYQWLTNLRPWYPTLAQQAERDKDPAVTADFAIDQMDDAMLAAVQAVATRPDFKSTLQTEMREIHVVHGEWLDEFIARVVEVSLPEDAPAPPPPARTRKKK